MSMADATFGVPADDAGARADRQDLLAAIAEIDHASSVRKAARAISPTSGKERSLIDGCAPAPVVRIANPRKFYSADADHAINKLLKRLSRTHWHVSCRN